nr:hypothetical protein [Tanacetum cinerariifolium]
MAAVAATPADTAVVAASTTANCRTPPPRHLHHPTDATI